MKDYFPTAWVLQHKHHITLHMTSASQSVGAATAFGSSCQHRLIGYYSPVHCSGESPQLMLPTGNPPVIQSKEASTWNLWTWRERWAVDSPRVKARAGGACVKQSWANSLDREIRPGCHVGDPTGVWGLSQSDIVLLMALFSLALPLSARRPMAPQLENCFLKLY